MTNTKSTKRALLVSVMAMVICFTMLLGTTFAWFTDSETSRNNVIVSGNLDVTFEYSATGADDSWTALTNSEKVFEEPALWEPGYVEVVYLKVGNAGTLDLNYRLGVKIVSETAGVKTVNGVDETFNLSSYIKYAVIPYNEGETPTYTNSTAAIAAANATAKTLDEVYNEKYDIEAAAGDQYYVLIVYMPTTIGNEANYTTGKTAPEIILGLNVTATQKASEVDHFGSGNGIYDADGSDPANPNA